MALPQVPVARGTVEVDGTLVPVRGLTRAEAAKVQAVVSDPAESEIRILAPGTDTPEAEVRAWYESVPSDVVDLLIERIVGLSGLGEGARKSG